MNPMSELHPHSKESELVDKKTKVKGKKKTFSQEETERIIEFRKFANNITLGGIFNSTYKRSVRPRWISQT